MEESLPHLRRQIQVGNIKTVLLNGREVINHVISADLARLRPCGTLTVNSSLSCSLYCSENDGVRFFAWSTNLQSSHGVTLNFRQELGRWLGSAPGVDVDEQGAGICMPVDDANIDSEGYVVRGTVVESKAALFELLEGWLRNSAARTIGDVDNYGGKAWIRIKLDEREAVLNADTKRTAVAEYIKDARNRGPNSSWEILPNRNGRWNKLGFSEDGKATPGWYCYLEPAALGRGRV